MIKTELDLMECFRRTELVRWNDTLEVSLGSGTAGTASICRDLIHDLEDTPAASLPDVFFSAEDVLLNHRGWQMAD